MFDNPFYDKSKRIKLYKERYRGAHPNAGELNPVWQCTIKLRRGVERVKFSTGTKDGQQALIYAERRLEELLAREHLALPTNVRRFDIVCRMYIKELTNINEVDKDKVSDKKLELHTRAAQRFIDDRTCFGRQEMAKIRSKNVQRYFDKRVLDKAKKVINKKNQEPIIIDSDRTISKSYVNKEAQALRAIFRFALKIDAINEIPFIPSFKERDYIRQGLSIDEWEHLREYLDESYVKEVVNTNNAEMIHYRASLAEFAKLSVLTGLRTTEALRLKWSDWEVDSIDGVEIGYLTVRAEEIGARKTKKPRRIRVHSKVNSILAIRRSAVSFTEPTDYIFSHPKTDIYTKSTPIGSMKRSFATALRACGLLYDDYGNKRTLYQLRHTNAHLSRMAGKHIGDIADDLGNSIITSERFYVGVNTGERKGLPFDID